MRRDHSRRFQFESLESRNMMATLAGDYDLSGTVDQADYAVWIANFGNVGESPVDGNGDFVVDAGDYTVWRDNLGKTLADVAPDAPRGVTAAAVGATSIQINWQAASFATDYEVQRRAPGSETSFTTIQSNAVGTSFTDTTAVADTLYEYRVTASNNNGTSTPSQTAQATANQSNLTAHRPQSVFPLENPADAPNYDTFPRRPVREQDEQSNTLGPGIRINRDDDNFSGIADAFESGNEIERENDLIEVKVDRLPGQGDLVLVSGFQLSLYYDHDKETPISLEDGHTEALPFVGNTITVFAEWSDSDHGFVNLSLVESSSSTTLDVLRFHTFRSLIVAFGGNTQNPADTDGDGSIGDPVQGGPTGNREGIFDIAQSMYDTGWDVLAFDEEDVDAVEDIPYTEIKSAVFERSVEFYAVIGYSQGGGAVHDIIERLWDEDDIVSGMAVYLDAVDHDGAFAEND